jgi:hypothetical protein
MLEDGAPEPAVVWVEQASGQSPAPKLVMCVGVAARAVYGVLRRELGYPVHVELVPSATWKSKLAPGGGRLAQDGQGPGPQDPQAARHGGLQSASVEQGERIHRRRRVVRQQQRPDGQHGLGSRDARGQAEGARKTFALSG